MFTKTKLARHLALAEPKSSGIMSLPSTQPGSTRRKGGRQLGRVGRVFWTSEGKQSVPTGGRKGRKKPERNRLTAEKKAVRCARLGRLGRKTTHTAPGVVGL